MKHSLKFACIYLWWTSIYGQGYHLEKASWYLFIRCCRGAPFNKQKEIKYEKNFSIFYPRHVDCGVCCLCFRSTFIFTGRSCKIGESNLWRNFTSNFRWEWKTQQKQSWISFVVHQLVWWTLDIHLLRFLFIEFKWVYSEDWHNKHHLNVSGSFSKAHLWCIVQDFRNLLRSFYHLQASLLIMPTPSARPLKYPF